LSFTTLRAFFKVVANGLAAYAISEASLTDASPIAASVSAATVILCRQLMKGSRWETALAIASEGRRSEMLSALEFTTAKMPNRGAFAPEALRAAIYFLNQSDSFSEALNSSLEFAGPANYSPVLVGAIGGARWGALKIPSTAFSHLCIPLSIMESLADRFIFDY
jgi:ADP-ribosylglycohydrolase